MTTRQHIGLWLHGLSLRLYPQIVLMMEEALTPAIREQTITELAAAHHMQQAQQWQQHAAQRASRQ